MLLFPSSFKVRRSTFNVRFLLLLLTTPAWSLTPPKTLTLPQSTDWTHAIPNGNPRLAWLLLDQPAHTHLRGHLHADLHPLITAGPFFQPASLHPLSQEDALKSLRQTVATFPGKPDTATQLHLEWLGTAPEWRTTTLHLASGRTVSTFRIGTTTITRTLVTDPTSGAAYLHLLADHPGALSFRATLTAPGNTPTLIEDRRQLTRPLGENGQNQARAWILPFESDVETSGTSILLRGEGEALIILNIGPNTGPLSPSTAFKNLTQRHDPGQPHPNPAKLWHGILASLPTWPPPSPENP
jgi:hypothetical protein